MRDSDKPHDRIPLSRRTRIGELNEAFFYQLYLLLFWLACGIVAYIAVAFFSARWYWIVVVALGAASSLVSMAIALPRIVREEWYRYTYELNSSELKQFRSSHPTRTASWCALSDIRRSPSGQGSLLIFKDETGHEEAYLIDSIDGNSGLAEAVRANIESIGKAGLIDDGRLQSLRREYEGYDDIAVNVPRWRWHLYGQIVVLAFVAMFYLIPDWRERYDPRVIYGGLAAMAVVVALGTELILYWARKKRAALKSAMERIESEIAARNQK